MQNHKILAGLHFCVGGKSASQLKTGLTGETVNLSLLWLDGLSCKQHYQSQDWDRDEWGWSLDKSAQGMCFPVWLETSSSSQRQSASVDAIACNKVSFSLCLQFAQHMDFFGSLLFLCHRHHVGFCRVHIAQWEGVFREECRIRNLEIGVKRSCGCHVRLRQRSRNLLYLRGERWSAMVVTGM